MKTLQNFLTTKHSELLENAYKVEVNSNYKYSTCTISIMYNDGSMCYITWLDGNTYFKLYGPFGLPIKTLTNYDDFWNECNTYFNVNNTKSLLETYENKNGFYRKYYPGFNGFFVKYSEEKNYSYDL